MTYLLFLYILYLFLFLLAWKICLKHNKGSYTADENIVLGFCKLYCISLQDYEAKRIEKENGEKIK